MTHENIDNLLDSLSDMYDKDAIEIDYQNNNFDLESHYIDDYHKANIIADSFNNGQIKQARDQYSRYGLRPSELSEYLTPDQIIKLLDY